MKGWDKAEVGDLRVWWCPQVPMSVDDMFHVDVYSVYEAALLLKVLARYDIYQFENKIKPDFSNAGGLLMWTADSDGCGNPGWNNWFDEATGIDDPEEYVEYTRKEFAATREALDKSGAV